jgi:hypothetical protein
MTVCVEFTNGESRNFAGSKFLDLNFERSSLTFRQDQDLVYVNLNSVNHITFIEEKETEEDAD